MIAVDTNVLARYLTNDDPAQAARALELMTREQVFLPKTVLLELEWVLRAAYQYDHPTILKAMKGLLGLPNVSAEDATHLADAIRWYEAGIDFADALHVASSGGAERFMTFDDRLAKRAKKLTPVAVVSF